MPFEIIRNDLTKMSVDAIVNTANPRPVIGDGTDRAVHGAAGPELLDARRKIGEIACGESAVTPAFGLDAKYVIHTVSPSWNDGRHGEEELLRRAYESALAAAIQYHCRSVAFPLMAAGSYGFPKDLALSIAVHTCQEFLLKHRMHIYLVVFNRKAFRLSQRLVTDVRSYIDEHYVEEKRKTERLWGRTREHRRQEWELCEETSCEETVDAASEICPESSLQQLREGLTQRLQEQSETFSEAMNRIIREKELLDTEVYGRIDMNRTTFNKIKNGKDHRPRRDKAIQLAVALRLNLDQTQDLIGKAGYILTESSRWDLILAYCLKQRIYEPMEIDALLDELGENTLFSIK